MNEKETTSEATYRAAGIFWNGGSQVVRLPREFRFEDDGVLIRRDGERVILEPVRKVDWPEGYWEDLAALRDGIELEEVEPLGGELMDLQVDSP